MRYSKKTGKQTQKKNTPLKTSSNQFPVSTDKEKIQLLFTINQTNPPTTAVKATNARFPFDNSSIGP